MAIKIPDGCLVVPDLDRELCTGCAFEYERQSDCPMTLGVLSCRLLKVELGCTVIFVKTPESWKVRNGIWDGRISKEILGAT